MSLSGSAFYGGIVAALFTSWKLLEWTRSILRTRFYNSVREQKKGELYRLNSNWAHQVSNLVSRLFLNWPNKVELMALYNWGPY